MIVEFSDVADKELEAIGDYIALANPFRAKSFVREIRDRCASLLNFSQRFAIVPRYQRQGIRHFAHGSYLVFYRIESDRVLILHVLHGARNYGAILDP